MTANQINITEGSGKSMATETISGLDYSKVKLIDSTASSTTPTGVAANPLQVSVANTGANATAIKVDNSGVTQPVSGTLTVQQSTASSLKVDLSGTGANSTALKVDNSAVTQPISGTVSTNADGTTGSAVPGKGLLMQGSDGTNARNISTTTGGVVKIDLSATAANSTAVKVDGSAVTQPVSIATNTPSGPTASGSSLTANPITVGGRAATANPSAVTDGQVVNAAFTKTGKLVTVDGAPRDLIIQQQTTITSTVSETTVLTAVASTFLDVYGVIVTNSSTTAVNVAFKDSTSGTERFRIAVPAQETRGFMLPPSGAHLQSTVNNNWTATSSGSVASLYITVFAVKNI